MKKRGRPSKADAEAEKLVKATADKAAEEARREEQAADVSKLLRPVLKGASKLFLAEDNTLEDEEVKEIGDTGAALLCKYVDLRGIEKYQEEIAFAWAVGAAITKRVDFSAHPEGERDSGESGDGEKPLVKSAAD